MSKSPDNVTQTTTSAPPSYLEPYLRQAAGYAQQLFQSGPQQYYPGNTVVPFSPQTNQALNMQQNRAINGSPLVDTAQAATQNIAAGNTPLAQLLAPQMGPVGSAALGNLSNPQTGPVGASALSPLTSQGTIGGAGGSNLLATASGDFLNSNPFLDATFDRAAGAVNRNLDTVLARSGRDLTGNIGARADALGNLANDIYGSNFQAERNRQLQAAGQLSSQGAGALGQLSGQQFGAGQNALNRQAQQQSQLSSQIFGGGQNALDRQLSAAGQIGQQQLAAAGQAIPLAREDYFDIGQLGQVGAAVEQQAGNIQNDYMNRFNFAQGAPYESLNSFIGALSGAPYGGSQSSTQPVFSNPLSNLMGLGLGFGAMFGSGGFFPGVFSGSAPATSPMIPII